MNLASWIILGIVVLMIALAVRATFFKKSSHGSCCDTGDPMGKHGSCNCEPSGCTACPACHDCATARNALRPTIRLR